MSQQTIYLVQARCYGETQGQVGFPTVEEAQAFAAECTAFEATRYLSGGWDDTHAYIAARESFDKSHPFRRFSRGVKFHVSPLVLGRPVKSGGAV